MVGGEEEIFHVRKAKDLHSLMQMQMREIGGYSRTGQTGTYARPRQRKPNMVLRAKGHSALMLPLKPTSHFAKLHQYRAKCEQKIGRALF